MIGVTTIRNYSYSVKMEAMKRSEALHLTYCPREGTLKEMESSFQMEGFLIYGKKIPFYYTKGEEYHFHFGTSVLRKEQIIRGNHDRLCSLLPQEGYCSVLDATFGQGGDSLTMSFFLGDRGHVTAIEKSLPLYEVGRAAIQTFKDPKEEEMTEALRRIELCHGDSFEYLKNGESGKFDVIYFDPMFRAPVKRKENHMEGFRKAASYDSLSEDILISALHMARKRIIVKERPFSPLFRNSLFTEVYAKKGQTTAYGVIDI